MDFSSIKAITIPEGTVTKITASGIILWQAVTYKNWVKFSTESDGVTIYNGGKGYKDGYRVRSGGAEASTANGSVTGFIPAKAGDVIRMSGYNALQTANENAINVFNDILSNLGQSCAGNASYGYGMFTESAYSSYNWGKANGVVEESAGVYKWTVPPNSDIAFIRITGYTGGKGASMIVTVNEEIA